MENVVENERQVLESLLALTGLNFTEGVEGEVNLPDNLAAWQFKTETGEVTSHVFVIENAAARQNALDWLVEKYPNDNEPLVSYNGRLVFAVQYSGTQSDDASYVARDVASALSGEEE